MGSCAFGLSKGRFKKPAVDFAAQRIFYPEGREITLTGLAEIIRKALLHLTNDSHLIIMDITSTASARQPDNHVGKYIRVITPRA